MSFGGFCILIHDKVKPFIRRGRKATVLQKDGRAAEEFDFGKLGFLFRNSRLHMREWLSLEIFMSCHATQMHMQACAQLINFILKLDESHLNKCDNCVYGAVIQMKPFQTRED